MTYEKMEGRRKGSTVYVFQNYIYSVSSKYKENLRLRCIHHKNEVCKGKAILNTSSDSFTVTKLHNHPPDSDQINVIKFKSDLKNIVSSSEGDIPTIYRQVSSKYPEHIVQQLPYRNIKSILHKRRKESQPKNDTPVEEDEEPVTRCPVCLGPVQETWAFVPCGHSPFCGSCSGAVIALNNVCPLCRQIVTSRLRVFSI